nr:MAG TPA: hypothetical protein [Caudoviricetes sp.]
MLVKSSIIYLLAVSNWARAYKIRFYKTLIRKNLVIFFVLY